MIIIIKHWFIICEDNNSIISLFTLVEQTDIKINVIFPQQFLSFHVSFLLIIYSDSLALSLLCFYITVLLQRIHVNKRWARKFRKANKIILIIIIELIMLLLQEIFIMLLFSIKIVSNIWQFYFTEWNFGTTWLSRLQFLSNYTNHQTNRQIIQIDIIVILNTMKEQIIL